MFRNARLALIFISLAAGAALAGCSSDVQSTKFPQITFAHLTPIQLDVTRVDIVRAETPVGGKNVEQEMPAKPEAALEQWAHDRLQPVGGNNIAHFIITQASTVEVELPRTPGVRGALTTEPAQRYDGAMEVTLEIVDNKNQQLAAVATKVQRSHSVQEGVTLAQREAEWFAMVDNMMQDFNRAFEAQIRNNLTKWVMR